MLIFSVTQQLYSSRSVHVQEIRHTATHQGSGLDEGWLGLDWTGIGYVLGWTRPGARLGSHHNVPVQYLYLYHNVPVQLVPVEMGRIKLRKGWMEKD